MGFTVIHPRGTRDVVYEAYNRQLRKEGKDIGRLLRVPEPGARRRWLPVWESETAARKFAEVLTKRTGDDAWQVVAVTEPPSEGPLGPLIIQMQRSPLGLSFALHIQTGFLLRTAFPQAFGFTRVFLLLEAWNEYLKTRGDLTDLAREVVPILTGLKHNEWAELGFVVIDDATQDTYAYVSPFAADQGGESGSVSSPLATGTG